MPKTNFVIQFQDGRFYSRSYDYVRGNLTTGRVNGGKGEATWATRKGAEAFLQKKQELDNWGGHCNWKKATVVEVPTYETVSAIRKLKYALLDLYHPDLSTMDIDGLVTDIDDLVEEIKQTRAETKEKE